MGQASGDPAQAGHSDIIVLKSLTSCGARFRVLDFCCPFLGFHECRLECIADGLCSCVVGQGDRRNASVLRSDPVQIGDHFVDPLDAIDSFPFEEHVVASLLVVRCPFADFQGNTPHGNEALDLVSELFVSQPLSNGRAELLVPVGPFHFFLAGKWDRENLTRRHFANFRVVLGHSFGVLVAGACEYDDLAGLEFCTKFMRANKRENQDK